MKTSFTKLTAFRTILIISLLLMVLFIIGSGISCQSRAPALAPSVPSQGLPEEPTTGAPPVAPSIVEVTIEGFAYKPATLNIPVGTTVIWYNKDSVPHTVTARDKSFDSGSLPRDGSFSFTFKQKGTFEYYCTMHPYMEGKVVID